MQTRNRTPLLLTLSALSALFAAGCVTDVWFKPGATTADLARDKAACLAAVADIADDAEAAAPFEDCMAARDWYHSTPGAKAPRQTPDVAAGLLSSGDDTELSATGDLTPEDPAAPPAPAEALDPPSPALAAATKVTRTEIPRAVPLPKASADEPADPSERQFWFKLGASTATLATDQGKCRESIGGSAGDAEPSRWGESKDFDACMRKRGWTGGGIGR